MKGSNGRRSIYLRKTKDKDLIQYIDPLLERHDFSDIVRDLMRDGIKYRENKEHALVLQNNQFTHPQNKQTFEDIKITRKEVDEEDIKKRIDDF